MRYIRTSAAFGRRFGPSELRGLEPYLDFYGIHDGEQLGDHQGNHVDHHDALQCGRISVAWAGHRRLFGHEKKKENQQDYGKAGRVRTLVRQDFEDAFRSFDALITPTSPSVAFKIGEKVDDPLQMYLSDILTISANLAGIPGISIPCGYNREGLPIGLQILAKAFDEATLLRVAYAYEESTDWLERKPNIDLAR